MKKILLLVALLTITAINAQVKIGSNPLTLAAGANFQVEGTATTSQFYVSTGGNVGIGAVSPTLPLDIKGNNAGIKIEKFRNSNSAPRIDFIKAKGTEAVPLPITATETLGNITASGWANGGGLIGASSQISFLADGLIDSSTGSVPGRIDFFTTQLGSNGLTGRMTITSNGFVGIGDFAPISRLQVNGSLTIVDNAQGLGKVLVSDVNGTGTWTTLPIPKINTTSTPALTGDVYVAPNGGGVIMVAPTGEKWKLSVSATGVLSTTATP